MWLSPRLVPSPPRWSTSTRTTFRPAAAKTCASGMPTYPAPTMATSGFIPRKATYGERWLHYAPALGPLAQLVEQGTLNPKVAGSIPARPTSVALRPMNPDVAIVGAGYVGMPLARVFADAGKRVMLVDVNQAGVDGINRGESHIGDVPSGELKKLVDDGRVAATTDYDAVRDADAVIVALPTPLSSQREPDLSIVRSAVEQIAPRLQKGQLIVLKSTTYPGTTRECVKPILEQNGLKAGEDFHLAFSPERVDPGRKDWTTQNTPKLVGGLPAACTERAVELYSSAVDTVVPLSSPETAEMTKLLENIFRAVNIALVNELAQLCERMG